MSKPLHMIAGEDIISKHLAASGEVVGTQAGRLRAIQWVNGAAAGTAIFKDGGASGTEIHRVNSAASVLTGGWTVLPGGGIPFTTDLYCAITNTAFVNILWARDD